MTEAMATTVAPVIRLNVADGYPTSPSTSMIVCATANTAPAMMLVRRFGRVGRIRDKDPKSIATSRY
jgi:hypothetical protein